MNPIDAPDIVFTSRCVAAMGAALDPAGSLAPCTPRSHSLANYGAALVFSFYF